MEVPCHLSRFANAVGSSKVPDEFPNNFMKCYALQSPTGFFFYFNPIQLLDTIKRIDNFIFLFNFNSIPCTLFHLQSLFFLITPLPISCELHLRYLTVLLLLRKVFFKIILSLACRKMRTFCPCVFSDQILLLNSFNSIVIFQCTHLDSPGGEFSPV